MERNHFGFGKRILSAVICLAILLAFVPAQAAKAAESKTYTVIAGSDFQYSNSDHGIAGGHVRDILATIKNQGFESYDGLLFCGDYSQAFTTAASKEGVAYLKNVINEELPTLSDDHKFFLQGNHDMDEETTDGTLAASGAHETEGYSVFVINEKDYMWYSGMDEAAVKATAANLRSYLNAKCRTGYTKPIFIMSHVQLHYSMRTHNYGDGMYSKYLFDVINDAAGNGLNIFFLFGHNHSNGWDDYLGGASCYLNKGDSILIAQNSQTEYQEHTLNFTYMNAGYVGYYTRVNDGTDNTLTMSVFQITDDQVTVNRYSAEGIHDLKSQGVTNSYQNETAYSPDTRVLPSPQVVKLNKDIKATAVSGASVTGEGITSYEILAGASQCPQGYSICQNYQIRAQGYTDGSEVTVTLPVDSGFDSSRPVLVLDHQRGKTIPVMADGGSVTFTAEHMGSFTLAQDNAAAVSASGAIESYLRTVPQGEFIQQGVPYVITDSGLDKTSHWVLTGTALEKSVGSVTHTGLALEELANADTSPVWYYDGTNLRFGAPDGPYLNISCTGTYNGDSSVGLVTVGDYNAATSAKVSQFSTGPSYYMGAGTAEEPLYLAHRNSNADSIASTYAKYNYNVSLWYFNQVISSATLTVTPSQNTVTMKNTVLLSPSVTVGDMAAADYTVTWESPDTSVATVSADGIVTPVNPGQVSIKATLTTVGGSAVSGISVEVPITVISASKTDSTVSASTLLGYQQGDQEAPVAGQTYLVGFYAGGWYLTGNLLHQGDPDYKGLNGVEGVQVAAAPTVPNDIWYYDGTNLYSGTEYDANKCLIYENGMVTIGAVTDSNEAFVVDKDTYEYWPYLRVSAGKLNHYGGNPYNVASLYNGNNFMCFYKVIPDQKVALSVSPAKSVLYAGQELSLTPEVLVNDAVTDEYTVLWTSSDLCTATVDSQGVVHAQDGGEAIITATLVSINGNPATEFLSVEIPVQVVREQESDDSVSAQLMLERSLQPTTKLESGKAYMISSCLNDNWVWSDRFAVSKASSAYSGIVLEHFDLNGGLTPWYYFEEEADGAVRQYLRCGSVDGDANYLVCNTRDAQLGTADGILFDTVALIEASGSFQIYYSPTTRYLNQLGGEDFEVVAPTSNYSSNTASQWYFNTVLPGGALELKLNKPTANFHPGQTGAVSYTLTLDGVEVTDHQLDWASADTGIATVSNGQINVVATGSTMITATVTEVNGKALTTPLAVSVSVSTEDHSWIDATCTAAKTCSVCGATEGSAAPHSYEAVVTAPDCLNAGYTTYTCTVCGESYVDGYVDALGHSYDALVTAPTCTEAGFTTYSCSICGFSYTADRVDATGHSYETVTVDAACTEDGSVTDTCTVCGDTKVQVLPATGHSYETVTVDATCTADGSVTDTCVNCGDTQVQVLPATGHSYENGVCGTCGEADPDYVKPIVIPTLTLKAPALEFKDMVKVIAFFTVDNTKDVVEMGMVTYGSDVSEASIDTADHVIPGAILDESSGRYFASSQGINAKYLGDTVYLACYAKLTDGSYVYTKVAPYGAVQYATNQLKNSTDMKLKQLVAAMLNYGAAAQNYFGYNTDVLANASLTDEQIALPETYFDGMVSTVPAADAAKQGIFANNKGFSVRKPAISFEGAFSINYFFTPAYTPVDGITLYYWNEADFNAAEVLTVENASGAITMSDEGNNLYRGDITDIAAKNLSNAVYVAAVYSDGTTTWTSGVLGYSIGAYCASMAKGTDTMADLAKATAVYGYHANAYFNQEIV